MFFIQSTIDIMPIISYGLTVIGYMPEIYALLYVIITKKTIKPTINNSIWFIWIGAAVTYAVYAWFIGQYVFVVSNGITASLCSIVFILRLLQPSISTPSITNLLPPIVSNETLIGVSSNEGRGFLDSDFSETV